MAACLTLRPVRYRHAELFQQFKRLLALFKVLKVDVDGAKVAVRFFMFAAPSFICLKRATENSPIVTDRAARILSYRTSFGTLPSGRLSCGQ
jgi:hypothetical protein